jgi:hypothetical protein
MKWLLGLLVVISCLAVAAWAVADDSQAKLAQVTGNHEKYSDQTLEDRKSTPKAPPIPSLISEIRAVMDSTRIAELALRQELSQGQNPELTRRLGELKKSSRMRILHIQLRYAQEEGRKELERRILTSIEDLQRPGTPGGPRLSGRISPSPEVTPAVNQAGGS